MPPLEQLLQALQLPHYSLILAKLSQRQFRLFCTRALVPFRNIDRDAGQCRGPSLGIDDSFETAKNEFGLEFVQMNV